MSEIINGVPIGDLPGIESVPDDSMLVVEFLGKAYHMPGAVLRQMIQDVLDSLGDSVDDVTEARLTTAIETVLSSGKYSGVSPIVEVTKQEDETFVLHVVDAFGIKDYPIKVKVPDLSNGGNVMVALSGDPTNGYSVTMDGEAVTGDTLNKMAKEGSSIIGVVSSSLGFTLPNGFPNYVQEGTIFQYGNAVASRDPETFENPVGHKFEFHMRVNDVDYGLFYEEEQWKGVAVSAFLTLLLTEDDGAPYFSYNGQLLNSWYLSEILYMASITNRPVFCYQKDMRFYTEDGAAIIPQQYTAFTLTLTAAGDYVFTCEQDGYKYTLEVSGWGEYAPTAEKTIAYRTAESKADDLKTEDGTLFLLSAGEPIGEGVPIPTGDSNVFVGNYDTVTFTEIKTAHDAGKVCFLNLDGLMLPLLNLIDTEAVFVREVNDTTDFKVTVTSAGGKDVTLVDKNTPIYVSQSLSDAQKAQARTNIGAAAAADLSKYVTTGTAQTITGVKTFNAPANVAGTEQHTVKFKTSNGGAIIFGKEAANSGTMLRFDQVDGTTRLRFRGSDSAGAIVWEQPEQGAQLCVDLGKEGVDKRRITFPSSGGTLALTSQIPSLSGYLPLSGGLMTGSLKFQAASLPGKSLQYVCGVDAFGNGGEMGWQSKADFLSGYLTTTGTAAKATADANGNNIASTYANKNVGNTFNGEQKMINSTHCPTMNDIASGVGCSLKNARACDNQLIVAEIFAPNTTVTDSKINMSAVAGEIGFYHGGSGSGGQFTGKTQLARITSAGIYEGSTLLSNKYLAKSGGTMTGALNLKNSTWNLAGDDAYFGDNDTAGSFAIKGANGTTNLKMVTHNGTTYGTLSWNGSNFAFSNALNFPGGKMTGPLSFANGTALPQKASPAFILAVDDLNYGGQVGWTRVSTFTAGRATADGNGRNIVSTYATKDEVVTAANGSLKVTLSGTSVDKTLAQIETALNAGRHVYMVENDGQVYQLSMHIAGMMACFTSVVTSGTQVTVITVIVYDGMSPSVIKKTL